MFDTDFLRQSDSGAVSEYLVGLAKSYVPEWRADLSQPDMGAVLVKLFAHMLTGNVLRAKRLPDKISAQLVDMLGISPLPTRPARSAVQFSSVGTEKVFLPRGTKLSAKAGDGSALTFETLHSLTVISSEIGKAIFSRGSCGRIFYADGPNAISLYGKSQGTFPDAILTLEHPYLFRLKKNFGLRIFFDGITPGNLALLANPARFGWSLADETGAVRKADTEILENENCLRLTVEDSETEETGACVSVQCKALEPVLEEISASGIYIDSSADNIKPEQIWRDDILQENGRFYPFGKRLSLLCELRIACDEVLTQKGSDVTVRFRLEYKNSGYDLPEEQKRQYKLIMKADAPVPAPLTVIAQEVSLECWNGTGWMPVTTNPPARRIFAGEMTGEIELRFTCPGDISPIQIGAAERNWLRLRLLRADGCYLGNTIHCAPVISDMRFSYSYKRKSKRPDRTCILREMRETDITAGLKNNDNTGIFSPLSIDGDRLMVGFTSKPTGEIVNVYFDIEKPREPLWIEAEYSSRSGFRKMHLDDYTDGFSASNAIVFDAPQDFSKTEIYGESLYWVILRLRPRDENPGEIKIRGIYLNAVEVEGKRTADAEIFYTDELITQSELRLSSGGLLYAEVWVDETSNLSDLERTKLREQSHENVFEEHDSGGNLRRFWVRWNEVRDFRACNPLDRCYRLDRNSGIVRFPDGIHGRRPPADESRTIKIIPVTSTGGRGNMPKHSITQPLEQLDFIGGVDNFLDACGGYDAQSPETLLKYACSYIRCGNRVVTAEDMLDAVRFSCGEIAKLKIVYDGDIMTLLFLPYDFENALQLFSQTEEHIRETLSKNWHEPRRNIRIQLPDFAEVIVEAAVVSNGDALNEEETVRRRLKDFLHPITGGFGRAGWEIGVLPQREQILSVMQSAVPKASVELLRISVRNRTNGQYLSLCDMAGVQNIAAIPGKCNLTWRRKAENLHA